MFNISKIFNLFDEDNNFQDQNTESFIDYKTHPFYWISGFNKVIQHNYFFKKYMEKTFPLIENISKDNIDEVGDSMTHNRAWNYIINLDIKNEFHLECLKLKSDKKFIDNLDQSILFFENIEEYEKCYHLQQIKEKVNLSLEENSL